MIRYITTARLSGMLRTKWTLIEAALHDVQPVYINGTVQYPLHEALLAVRAYSGERKDDDGYLFHSKGLRRLEWQTCHERVTAALSALDRKGVAI